MAQKGGERGITGLSGGVGESTVAAAPVTILNMHSLRGDLLYGLRTWRKSPGVAAIATLTLTLGIGATTALFSAVNGILLDPLPYPHSEELAAIFENRPGDTRSPAIYLNFLDWERENRTFSSMAIYRNQDYNVSGLGEALRVSGYMVSAGFFPTLGANPILGRTFRKEDDRIGAAPVVMLGGGFWGREFGGENVIGRPLTLNGTLYTIIGVIPAGFRFYGQERDVYTPIGQWDDPSFLDRRISVSARVFGRLRPGVSLAEARGNMEAVAAHLAEAYPAADKGAGVTLLSMKDDMVGNVRPILATLLAAAGFLLLIACANVANLLLARSTSRAREFAVRTALGASGMRLVRQLLTESALVAVAGGALGVTLAFGAVAGARAALAAVLPRPENIAIDERVLWFAAAVTLLTAVLSGAAPALRGGRANIEAALREGGRNATGRRHGLQKLLVAAEVALAVILLTGAGLMLRSLAALLRVDPGYNPNHAITFSLSLPSTGATTPAETRARLRQFDDRMRAIPGVRAVSVTLGSRPMIHDSSLPFWIEGRPKPASDNDMPAAMFYLVEPGFQQAMGITLRRGRFVSPQDNEDAPLVIDIDEAFARMHFPNEDPIGKRVNLTQFNVQAEIVGVVGHVQQWGPGGGPKGALQAQFFYPFMQLPPKLMRLAAGGVAVVLRTEGNPADVMKQVRRAVQQMDPRQVIYGVQTMDGVIAGALAPRRLSWALLGIFAGLAALLSAVGIYGVVSFAAGQRRNEIGVRMALGAQRADVIRLVLAEGAAMAFAGALIGIAGAFVLTGWISNQLFGVAPHDPLTFAAAPVILAAAALLACYIPAWRAAKSDPVRALRFE